MMKFIQIQIWSDSCGVFKPNMILKNVLWIKYLERN